MNIRKRVVAYFDGISTDPSIKELLGLELINRSSTAVQLVKRGKLKFKDTRKEVEALGWETSDVLPALNKCIEIEDHFDKAWGIIEKLESVCNKLSALNDEYYEYYDSTTQTTDVVAVYGDFTKIIVDFANAFYDMFMIATDSLSEVNSSALQLGYAALKAKH